MTRDTDNPDVTGFAGRWSRMKRAAKTSELVEPEGMADEAAPAEDDRPDAEVLAELGLPDPDALEPGGDFAAFMAKAVPARIRNRALRRLWLSNPVLANVDGLVDYGGDFTDSAMVIENLQTAYQVGKGFVDRLSELAGEPEAVPADPGESVSGANPERGSPEAAELDATGHPPEGTEASDVLAPSRPEPAPAHARRMKFHLTEE